MYLNDLMQGERFVVAIWSSNGGQDDLKWYTLDVQPDGSLLTSVKMSNHGDKGTYHAHLYYYNTSGTPELFKTTSFTVNKVVEGTSSNDLSEALLSTGFTNSSERYYSIEVSNFIPEKGATFQAAVWSAANGQDDLVWYGMKTLSSDSFGTTVRIADHGDVGTYHVHVLF